MIKLRRAQERGHFQSDWLDSYHSFSFDTYHDPKHMGFRTLRVINQDRVSVGEVQRISAGSGFAHSEYNPSQSEEEHLRLETGAEARFLLFDLN